ncbi:MAG: hypothetical protein AB4058_02485 [Microcystaceae cyanobacterium]
MTQPLPNPEKIQQTVEKLKASNRQLELVTLAFDELIAKIDQDLRQQRRKRLQMAQKV